MEEAEGSMFLGFGGGRRAPEMEGRRKPKGSSGREQPFYRIVGMAASGEYYFCTLRGYSPCTFILFQCEFSLL